MTSIIDRVFLGLAEASRARPRRVIVLWAVLVLAAVPGLFRLELRTDGHALVPASDPAVLRDQEIRRHFGYRDPILVLVESTHPRGIYNTATLSRVRDLSLAFRELPGVGPESVMSLATERSDRFDAAKRKYRPFLDPLPETPGEMERLRRDLDATEVFKATLVSPDARATAILVGVPEAGSGAPGARFGERHALYQRIRDLAGSGAPGNGSDSSERVLLAGAPVAESLLGVHILEDLGRILPLALAVTALVLWLGCRRLWGVVLGFCEMGACLLFTFGLMGWLGSPVYLTTAVLPVILVSIGLADEIHVLWHYQHLLAREESTAPSEVVRATFREMTRPVVCTTLTTAVGFLSFLASEIVPVRTFGLFAAVGIVFCLFYTLSVVPAALTLIPAEKMRRPRNRRARSGAPWGPPLAAALLRRRGFVLTGVVLATVALGSGAWRLRVQDSWVDGFAPGSPLRQATERINTLLNGTHVLALHLTFDPPGASPVIGPYSGPLLDPAALAAVGELEAFLDRRPDVGRVVGLYRQLITVSYLWGGRLERYRSPPDEPREVLGLIRRLQLVRGLHRRRDLVDDDFRRTLVVCFLKDANYRDTAVLMEALRAYERRHLAPLGARLDFAGDVAVSQAMIPAIVRSQVSSLLLALFGAWVALAVLYRSPHRALLAAAPACLAVVWVFGAMGWLGIPVGVATSMFCAITLGIGIDYGIHFLERHQRARARRAPSPVLEALATAGPAITADTLAIGLGFGLLGFSQVPANARLGLLVAMALAASCFLTLGGLAAWLTAQRADPNPAK